MRMSEWKPFESVEQMERVIRAQGSYSVRHIDGRKGKAYRCHDLKIRFEADGSEPEVVNVTDIGPENASPFESLYEQMAKERRKKAVREAGEAILSVLRASESPFGSYAEVEEATRRDFRRTLKEVEAYCLGVAKGLREPEAD